MSQMIRIFNRNQITFKLGKSLKQTELFRLSAFHKVLSTFESIFFFFIGNVMQTHCPCKSAISSVYKNWKSTTYFSLTSQKLQVLYAPICFVQLVLPFALYTHYHLQWLMIWWGKEIIFWAVSLIRALPFTIGHWSVCVKSVLVSTFLWLN
jgi:hypothetical protein